MLIGCLFRRVLLVMNESVTGKHYLLENYELIISKKDVKRFRDAWTNGMTISKIATYMRMSEVQVILLGLDQFRLDQVKARLQK